MFKEVISMDISNDCGSCGVTIITTIHVSVLSFIVYIIILIFKLLNLFMNKKLNLLNHFTIFINLALRHIK